MSSPKTYRKVTWLTLVALFLLAVSAMNSPNEIQVCEISIDVGDTTAFPNTINNVIPIYIDNPLDTVVGFQLWIQLDRPPDIMIFQTDLDTTETLVAGWEYVNANSLSGNGTDLLITGIADLPGGPITRGFGPQTGGTLINMLADVLDVSDNVTSRIVNMEINTIFIPNFNIVLADLSWSPWIYETYLDTNFFVCTDWLIDTTQNPPDTIECLSWQQTSGPAWDSIEVVLDSIPSLDTSRVCITDGSLEVLLSYICGDANGDGTPGDILDLTFMVDRIFRGGPGSDPPQASDFNCDGFYGNIVDLTIIVDFVFRGGDPLCSAVECFK